ncbi:MAG: F0F1 ATP synthase subunit A [Verrucomicrobia bacterium]|nr:F0F1 ATP synthase subunit A [Verrucomicrobiota bacterium]
MSRAKILTLLLSLPITGLPAFAAETGHGLSPKAEALFHVGPLPITNSILTSWIVAALLVIAVRLFVGRPQLVPTRGQAVVENLLHGMRDLTAPIVGNKVAKYAFPLLITLFTFILIQNWSGLVPGVGTIFVKNSEGEMVELARPGNADLNGTAALAICAITCWFYFIMRYAGPRAVLKDIFGNKAQKSEMPAAVYYPLFLVFFVIGIIELVSIVFRPISLSFRLFGNVFGGENLLHAMSAISRWGLPVPFYFLEFIIGFVQALVFTLLVSVYIGLICNHGDGEHHDAH